MDLKMKHGDLIIVDYNYFKHMGIYDEENKSIIEIIGTATTAFIYLRTQFLNLLKLKFNGWKQSDTVTVIQSTPINEFIFRNIGRNVYIDHSYYLDYYGNRDPKQIVEKAKCAIGQKGWNPATRNCEHFAMWAKTGKSISFQVQNYEFAISLTTLAIMIISTTINFIITFLSFLKFELEFDFDTTIKLLNYYDYNVHYQFNLYKYTNINLIVMFFGTIIIFLAKYLCSLNGIKAKFENSSSTCK